MRKTCKTLEVPISTFYTVRESLPILHMDHFIENKIRKTIDEKPAVGVRMIVAMLRASLKQNINQKRFIESLS